MDVPGELFRLAGPGFSRKARECRAMLQGPLWPELTFSLVLTAAKLLASALAGKYFHLPSGEPSIISILPVSGKPHGSLPMAAMVRLIASLWGVCTHLGRLLSQPGHGPAWLPH